MLEHEPLVTDVIEATDEVTGEVLSVPGRQLVLPGEVSGTGLSLPTDLTFDQWSGVGMGLQAAGQSLMWWLGDWALYGEKKWGEMYAQAVGESGRSAESVRVAKWVAKKFPPVMRITALSWNHHRIAASVEAQDARTNWLLRAEREGWSTRELSSAISKAKQTAPKEDGEIDYATCVVDDLHQLIRDGRRFGSIYADPPWLYDNQGTRAATSDHYGGMSIEALCELPVAELAAPDAQLHLWTTNGFLFDCPKLFEAWGFEFRSSFVWVKSQIGIGNYWRNAHEFLLTAVRGKAKRFKDKTLRSWSETWIECERGAHSEKPEQVRRYVERASPGPFLELFGRREVKGWCVWGDEVRRDSLFAEAEAERPEAPTSPQLRLLPESDAA